MLSCHEAGQLEVRGKASPCVWPGLSSVLARLHYAVVDHVVDKVAVRVECAQEHVLGGRWSVVLKGLAASCPAVLLDEVLQHLARRASEV